jgi:exo-beta-1,3-glucanase (GH17 family)
MKWYGMVAIAVVVVAALGGVVYMGINTDKFVKEKHTKTTDIKSTVIQSSQKAEMKDLNNSDGLDQLISKADTVYHVEYNYVESLRIYEQVIEIQSANIVALNGAGYSLVKLNQNVDAIEYFDTVLSIDGVNAPARVGIGNALYNMDKPDEAVYHYTQALLQSDTDIDAMMGMAASTFDLERYGETVLWVDKILEMDPDNSSAISIQVNLKLKNITEQDIDLAATKLLGIAYSPYRAGQSPITGPHPSVDDIENDIRFISSVTDRIRVYGLDGNNQHVPEIAKKYGLKVAVTLLLTGDDASDQAKIERGILIANEHPDTIYTLIVENEGLYRGTLNEEQIISYLIQITEKLNSEITITIAEPSYIWLQHPKIAKYVDYVMIHHYSYWGGIEINNATGKVFDAYYEVRDTFGKDVVIGETGWPSGGRNVNQAVPSPENQQKFVSEFREIADARDIDYFVFEAFDEKWKLEEVFDSGGSNNAENHWGLFYENGTMKEYLDDVIPSLQHVTTRK